MSAAKKRRRGPSTARGDTKRDGRSGSPVVPDRRAFLLPLTFTALLAALSFTPRVQTSSVLVWSFWGAVAALLAWQATLFRRVRAPSVRTWRVQLRAQHYVQALVQVAVLGYWGWFWSPVYDMAVLIAAQLAFAYAFDVLLSWSRRETYVLGFGPFPIILSINLFLWFRDEWFYLQFLMVALGFLGKEFVKWTRDGRRVHIFNPSAFSLGLFSIVLIATGSSDLTWGQQIASTLSLAPQIYLFLFAVGLVVMFFFSITLVAGSAAAALFGMSALYSAFTGVPYFLDSEIPAAVFLGLHLLITDPSTSPRTPSGKVVFGGLYGVGVFGLYWLLGATGSPTFYDKLLCVPLLNLSVKGIDHLVQSVGSNPAWDRWRLGWAPSRLNLAHMAVWIVFFGAMTALGRTDGTHRGDRLPFWEQACAEDRRNACRRLLEIELTYCGDNSAWACNELGGHYRVGQIVAGDRERALTYFSRACDLRFQAACLNLLDTDGFTRSTPKPLDLRLLLREGGLNLLDMPEPELYARACDHLWSFACERGVIPS